MNINWKEYECETMGFIKGDGVVKTFKVEIPPASVGDCPPASVGGFDHISLDQLELIGSEAAKALFGT